MEDFPKIYAEFRVRPVTRYVVTKYVVHEDGPASVITLGEFDNEMSANGAVEAFGHLAKSQYSGVKVFPINTDHKFD